MQSNNVTHLELTLDCILFSTFVICLAMHVTDSAILLEIIKQHCMNSSKTILITYLMTLNS